MHSLRRTLAVRYSLTMFVALVAIALWAWVGTRRIVSGELAHQVTSAPRLEAVGPPAAHIDRQVLFFMLGTVVLGTVATAFGASWLARSAVQPVTQIAEQAEGIAPGAAGQRITAHGDVAEFQTLIGVLNRMLERLDRAWLAERRIVRDVGHDLRTPLTAMQGEIEIALRRARKPDEYRAVLRSVLDEAEHLSRISEALIALARFDAGDLVPQRAVTDLVALAHDVASRCTGPEHFVTVTGAPVEATVDPDLVRIALMQLVENAVVHTPPGTRVVIRTADELGVPTVAVEDDGPGLPTDARAHLFERFYRADEARARRGAGLGLSLVAAIMGAHGGTAQAAERDGRGLRITLRF